MVYCLTPSNYLNRCWFISNGALQHVPENNFTRSTEKFNLQHELENYTFNTITKSRNSNKLKMYLDIVFHCVNGVLFYWSWISKYILVELLTSFFFVDVCFALYLCKPWNLNWLSVKYVALAYISCQGIHTMMTSSNGNIFRVTGHLCGEFTGVRWIPRTKASDAELWCFLWSASNKRFCKQSWGWWFETPSLPLWRHRNAVPTFWNNTQVVTYGCIFIPRGLLKFIIYCFNYLLKNVKTLFIVHQNLRVDHW